MKIPLLSIDNMTPTKIQEVNEYLQSVAEIFFHNTLGEKRQDFESIERNRRQYCLMAKSLHQFEQGNLKLDRLINVLDALLEALQNPNEEWEENLRSEWCILEKIYAVALDKGQATLSPENQNLTNKTIKSMTFLLKAQLSE